MSEIVVYQTPGGEEPDDIAFAEVDDVRLRMGKASFTDAESAQVKWLLAAAASLILDEIGKTDAWALENVADAVPRAWRTTSIEAVTRVMQNPKGVRSQSFTLGARSHGESFADATATLELTRGERDRCQRAAGRPSAASVQVASTLDKIGPYLGETGAPYTSTTEE